MAYVPVLNDVVEVVDWSIFAEQAAANVHHYIVTSVGGAANLTLQDVADLRAALAGPLYAACMSSLAEYGGCTAKKLSPGLPSATYPSAIAHIVGSVAGDALPRQITGLISYQTDIPGPSGRGRSYIPFPAESNNAAASVPDAPYLAQLVLLGDFLSSPQALADAFSNIQLTPVIRSAGPVFTNTHITGFKARPRWATQRRRGSFGAANVSPV